MLRFLGLLVLLAVSFGAGFYAGRHSIDALISDLKHSVSELSNALVEKTATFERSLRERQGLVDAKEEVIQAKAEALDRNYGKAADALQAAVRHLEQARKEEGREGALRMTAVIEKIRHSERELRSGKRYRRGMLDELREEVDGLMERH